MRKTAEELKKELNDSELNDVNGAGSWSRDFLLGSATNPGLGTNDIRLVGLKPEDTKTQDA